MHRWTRTEVGTGITLFLNEDCLQFCNEYKATEVIKKYCSFMPVELLSRKIHQRHETIEADLRTKWIAIHEEPSEEVKRRATKEEDPRDKLKITKRPELIKRYPPALDEAPQ